MLTRQGEWGQRAIAGSNRSAPRWHGVDVSEHLLILGRVPLS